MRANKQECGNLSTWFILNYPTGALSVLNEGEVEGWIARAFYFIYLSNLSSRETFCLKSFIYVQKIEKLKMMLLQRKRRWKGTITWPFFFFPLWGLVISREQVAGAHLWSTQGEDHCIGTKPRRMCVYKHLHEQRAFELFNSFFFHPLLEFTKLLKAFRVIESKIIF